MGKAPKSRLYNISLAANAKVASAISKKNNGEMYIADIAKNLSLSLGWNPLKHCSRVDEYIV